jgi:hypothetical protein
METTVENGNNTYDIDSNTVEENCTAMTGISIKFIRETTLKLL